MKTAQRVLATALDLFNQHGESSVTSVDIANEMDISPGNLYYHFKGKELIVDALFDLHQRQLNTLLDASQPEQLDLEEQFYYVYLLLEKIHLYRFIYRSPMDLMEKYPAVAKGLGKIAKRLEATIERILSVNVERQALAIGDDELKPLVESIAIVMLQSTQYYQLKQHFDDEHQIYSALALLLTLLGPRMLVPIENLSTSQQSIAMHKFTRSEE